MLTRLFARQFSKKYPTLPYVKEDVRYEIIQEKHQDQVLDIVAGAWHYGEPLTKSRNLSLEGITTLWSHIVPLFCTNGLSICAIDVPTEKLIGCHLIADFADEPEPAGPEIDALLSSDPGWGYIF